MFTYSSCIPTNQSYLPHWGVSSFFLSLEGATGKFLPSGYGTLVWRWHLRMLMALYDDDVDVDVNVDVDDDADEDKN